VVARQAIENRRDSRRYIEWKTGAAPSTDIYLVEKMTGDPFILATLLGPDVNSDVVKLLPRDGYDPSYGGNEQQLIFSIQFGCQGRNLSPN
jgi:hypothetical protein